MSPFKSLRLAACLVAFSGSAFAGPIPLASGTWKVGMSIPGVPSQVEAMLNKNIPEVCLRSGAHQPPHMPRFKAAHCHIEDESSNANHWQATESCQAFHGHPALRIAMTIVVGPHRKSYIQTSRVLKGPGSGTPPSVMHGTWVSPTCAAISSAPAPVTAVPIQR